MALSRKFLEELLSDREDRATLVDEIIEAHVDTVDGLKADLNDLGVAWNSKTTGSELREKLEQAEKELAELKESGANTEGENAAYWKARYESVEREFAAEREKNERKAAFEEKSKEFRVLLEETGIHPRLVNAISRCCREEIDKIELQSGRIRNRETLRGWIQSEFGDYITGSKKKPVSGAPIRTKEDIMNISDRSERLKAIENNMALFQQ